MDWFARRFVQSSLVWLSLGVTLGIAMAIWPGLTIYRSAHMHMNLLGFVTMMIFGVAYHVLPRFTGQPLWSRRVAGWSWWASNAGLVLMVGGFGLRVTSGASMVLATTVLGVGGAIAAAGAYMFAFNIWRTIANRAAPPSPPVGIQPRR